MSAITNASTLALATMDVLAERNWCQGQPENPGGEVCLIGAVNIAAYGDAAPSGEDAEDYRTPAVVALADAFLEVGITDRYYGLGDSVSAMFGWNDNPHRNSMQVATGLMRIALYAEKVPLDLSLD